MWIWHSLYSVFLASVLLLLFLMLQETDLRCDRIWTGPITASRQSRGAYYTTVPKLLHDDEDTNLPLNRIGTFRNYFRLNRQQFDFVLGKVEHLITKDNTAFRDSISAEQRLMVTLRYLATGSSMSQLHYDWCISVASLSAIIPETCRAIYTALRNDYLRTPTTEQEWTTISSKLEENWNFPNAIGNVSVGERCYAVAVTI